jgi:hypothetical protein
MNDLSTLYTWGETLQLSLMRLWQNFLDYIPELLGALIILIIGVILASILGRIARRIVQAIKLDDLANQTGLKQGLEQVGLSLSFAGLIAWLVKWFFVVATLIAVVDTLRIPQVTLFLTDVALYIPQVIAAVVILGVAMVIARFVGNVVTKAVEAANVATAPANALGAIARWAIIVFGFMAALVQLGVAESLIQIFFTGFVAMLALAGGLAFGLGGREHASRLLDELTNQLKRR